MIRNPRDTTWKFIKLAMRCVYLLHLLLLCLVPVLKFHFPVYPFITMNKNMRGKWYLGYCCTVGSKEIRDSLNAAFKICPKVLFSALLAWPSNSVFVILLGDEYWEHSASLRGFHQLHSHMRVIGPIGPWVPMQQPTQQMYCLCTGELLSFQQGTVQSLKGGWLRTSNWSSFFREELLSRKNLSPRPEHNMIWQGCRWET